MLECNSMEFGHPKVPGPNEPVSMNICPLPALRLLRKPDRCMSSFSSCSICLSQSGVKGHEVELKLMWLPLHLRDIHGNGLPYILPNPIPPISAPSASTSRRELWTPDYFNRSILSSLLSTTFHNKIYKQLSPASLEATTDFLLNSFLFHSPVH